MLSSITLVTAFTVLSAIFCPTVSTPMPALAKPIIERQGRDFNSRFSPPLRPVFPRSYFENVTKREPETATPVEKRDPAPVPAPVVDYADYIGPTASVGLGVGLHVRYD